MIFDYHNADYMSGETDSVTGCGEGKKNKRKLTTPKRTANEDTVSGSGKFAENILIETETYETRTFDFRRHQCGHIDRR